MKYWTLKYYSSRDRGDLFLRSKDGKVMLFPSRDDAEMYRDAYYGPQAVHIHKVVELEVERAEDKPGYQLMTAIKWWETRQREVTK